MELAVNHRAIKIKGILGNIEHSVWGPNNSGSNLLVLNYHGTPFKFIENFKEHIKYFKKHFHLISPSGIHDFFDDNTVFYKKRPLLITFDDGMQNNLHAVSVLNEYELKGLYFIIPEFVNSKEPARFYQKNIRPVIDKSIESQQEDLSPMNWEMLKDIMRQGHTIGSHSLTHLLKNSSTPEESEKEIILSKKILEQTLNSTVEHFCAPNDSLSSVGALQMKMIKNNYRYFHSTYPGQNKQMGNPYFIRRVNVECFWPLSTVKFAIGRFDEKRFTAQEQAFATLAGS